MCSAESASPGSTQESVLADLVIRLGSGSGEGGDAGADGAFATDSDGVQLVVLPELFEPPEEEEPDPSSAPALGGLRALMVTRGATLRNFVSSDMEETFHDWMRIGEIPHPDSEVTVFSSLSGNMLQNPAPYGAYLPRTHLMTQDLEALAHLVGLGRVATDGTVVGMHFLMPVERPTASGSRGPSTRSSAPASDGALLMEGVRLLDESRA